MGMGFGEPCFKSKNQIFLKLINMPKLRFPLLNIYHRYQSRLPYVIVRNLNTTDVLL